MPTTTDSAGSIAALWRYPVKSMMGEEVNSAYVTERGLYGDRAYALIDAATGKVASAKNPSKWPTLFRYRAAYTTPPDPEAPLPPVRVMLPDGETLTTGGDELAPRLSDELGRPVQIRSSAPEGAMLEEYWPDIEGLTLRETVTDEALPEGMFFDLAVLHLLTTATLDRLRGLYPPGRFEVRRFRPNIVVETGGEPGFAENAWIDRTLALGDEVRLQITGPCPRCVMTTLAQYDLPRDPGILRAAAQHNGANVGVYASVLRGGTIRAGDSLRLE